MAATAVAAILSLNSHHHRLVVSVCVCLYVCFVAPKGKGQRRVHCIHTHSFNRSLTRVQRIHILAQTVELVLLSRTPGLNEFDSEPLLRKVKKAGKTGEKRKKRRRKEVKEERW